MLLAIPFLLLIQYKLISYLSEINEFISYITTWAKGTGINVIRAILIEHDEGYV